MGRLVVRARFSVQAVKVRVTVTGGDGVSTVACDGLGDDIGGCGFHKIIDGLIRELA